jgi:hypothetical protein
MYGVLLLRKEIKKLFKTAKCSHVFSDVEKNMTHSIDGVYLLVSENKEK